MANGEVGETRVVNNKSLGRIIEDFLYRSAVI